MDVEVRAGTSVVLLAGPTASGKSRLALDLAARHGGIIVNADSMQVYSELRILSARPSLADEALAEHCLYGHVPAARRYSVGAWLVDVAPVLGDAAAAGRLAIVVGGTGLYFKALTEGLSSIPPIPPEIRQRLQSDAAASAPEALHARLAQRDPEAAATVRPSDRTRILRALEVIEATGVSVVSWNRAGNSPPVVGDAGTQRIVLDPDRAELHRRIAVRAAAMVRGGAVEEAAALARLDLEPSQPAMKAIGVREMLAHRDGRLSEEEAAVAIATETRRYARRQMTWFRNQMAGWRQHPV